MPARPTEIAIVQAHAQVNREGANPIGCDAGELAHDVSARPTGSHGGFYGRDGFLVIGPEWMLHGGQNKGGKENCQRIFLQYSLRGPNVSAVSTQKHRTKIHPRHLIPPVKAEDIHYFHAYKGLVAGLRHPKFHGRVAFLVAGNCDDLEYMWNKLGMSEPMDWHKCDKGILVAAAKLEG